MIVQYIEKWGKVQKKDIKALLWDKLPAGLDDKQREAKIKYLMYALCLKGVIETDSKNRRSANWILKKL